ncbi:three-helix bundle dimerization domain-containing protein [Actinomadura syzygii]|uniref:DUF3562 domain-containing protein n=1 Tax=Actinomadura syzygii TaxID=1427538 RepID=A0A5D0U4W2_9ACTN|nr:hypothetical protein [Actinomadura syzygii]TYC13107.1 hypothetical protein FXF65_21605 [Actinomadura syzygii]
MDTAAREKTAMTEVTARLMKAYGDTHDADEVAEAVSAIHHRFDGRPVRDFVPILVERDARRALSG